MAKYSGGLEDNLDIPETAVSVLEKRYLKKNEKGKLLETGEDMFRRVAKDIASAEVLYQPEFRDRIKKNYSTKELYSLAGESEKAKYWEEHYFNIMENRKFIPNSPTLMNAGRTLQQLSACFVLPIGDSMEEIFETVKKTAIIHKSGGGTGFSFSNLRPNGAYIHSTASYTPGPISFLRTFDTSTDTIKQGGKRRGANMGIMEANHPDALDWITVKREEGIMDNFNLSIAFTDEHIKAVRENSYILLQDPRKGKEYTVNNARNRTDNIKLGRRDYHQLYWDISKDEKSIVRKEDGKVIGKVEDGKLFIKAREIFSPIVEGAWRNGEPGIIFIDTINKYNPTPEVGRIESTNPCGEQPLLPYESCNLGSVNLAEHVKEDGTLDEVVLKESIQTGTRFLDGVIDRNKYPLPEIEKVTKANRKIGLGVMGFAHYLVKRGISYNSEEACEEARKVMGIINQVSKETSRELAKERGAFPNFDKSIYKFGEPIRNATTTTIAPTGTTAVIAAASQGIEPIYALVNTRKVESSIGKDLVEVDREFENYLKKVEIYDKEILGKLIETGTSIHEAPIPEKIKKEIERIFITAHYISPEQHIKIQQAFQENVDNAVSKTVNTPNETTREQIQEIYLKAHEMGLKGITAYRDGSRDNQLLETTLRLFPKNKGLEKKVENKNLRGRNIPGVIGLQGVTYEMSTDVVHFLLRLITIKITRL
jgi:ribonucleoside-diphosphate reductase alpha chain